MKSTELRIGNLVKTYSLHIGDYYTVVSIGDSFINRDSVLVYEDLHPIELTEEWYNKFQKQLINDGLEYSHSSITNRLFIYIGNRTIVCDYVHQLQNLYFALTNNELTL